MGKNSLADKTRRNRPWTAPRRSNFDRDLSLWRKEFTRMKRVSFQPPWLKQTVSTCSTTNLLWREGTWGAFSWKVEIPRRLWEETEDSFETSLQRASSSGVSEALGKVTRLARLLQTQIEVGEISWKCYHILKVGLRIFAAQRAFEKPCY